jgi:hypothetical protein
MGIAPLAGMWNGERKWGETLLSGLRSRFFYAAYLEYRYPLRLKANPDKTASDPVPLESILISSAASPMLNSPRLGSSSRMERRASASSIKITNEPAVALLEPEKEAQGINMVVLTKRLAWDQIFM